MSRNHLVLILILISSALYGQTDYYKIKKKKLTVISIDTAANRVLILENKFARLYFLQADLVEYIEFNNKNGNSAPFTFEEKFEGLSLLLNSGKEKIVLQDWWYTYTDVDRQEIFNNRDYTNSDEKFVNELQLIASDLLLDGNFMIYGKSEAKFLEKGLSVKKEVGLMGGESLYFYLPSKQYFWTVLLSLGE